MGTDDFLQVDVITGWSGYQQHPGKEGGGCLECRDFWPSLTLISLAAASHVSNFTFVILSHRFPPPVIRSTNCVKASLPTCFVDKMLSFTFSWMSSLDMSWNMPSWDVLTASFLGPKRWHSASRAFSLVIACSMFHIYFCFWTREYAIYDICLISIYFFLDRPFCERSILCFAHVSFLFFSQLTFSDVCKPTFSKLFHMTWLYSKKKRCYADFLKVPPNKHEGRKTPNFAQSRV